VFRRRIKESRESLVGRPWISVMRSGMSFSEIFGSLDMISDYKAFMVSRWRVGVVAKGKFW
jgi:hypothetical protein